MAPRETGLVAAVALPRCTQLREIHQRGESARIGVVHHRVAHAAPGKGEHEFMKRRQNKAAQVRVLG